MYADDIQLYVHCKPSGMIDAVARLERYIDMVDKWMAASRLKLTRTSLKSSGLAQCGLYTCTPAQKSLSAPVLFISDKVQLLGVGISADLTFDRHVTKIAGQCFYQLRQLRSVRQSLDTDSIKTLIRAFESSRLLLQSTRRLTSVSYRQTSTGSKCGRSGGHKYREIRERSDSDPTP